MKLEKLTKYCQVRKKIMKVQRKNKGHWSVKKDDPLNEFCKTKWIERSRAEPDPYILREYGLVFRVEQVMTNE